MKSIFVTSILLFSILANAQNVDQWRGKDRSGIYNETGLLEEWPESGPQLAWHYDDLGRGFSSVIVHSNKVYVTGMDESTGYVHCLTTDGKLVWKKKYGEEWTVNFPGTRTTPTYDNGRLYLMSTPGLAVCMDAADGNIIWQKDLAAVFGAEQLRFGMAESPLIVDDKIVYTLCRPIKTMVALNKNTGENVWINQSEGQTSAYCSPLLINHNGNKIIVTSIEKNVVGIKADDGTTLWSYPQTNRYNIHPNTPVYDGKNIYSTSGYGKGTIMLKLSEDGSSVTLGWENPSLDSQMGGTVLADGKLYGSGQNNRQWQCLDAKTGTVLYEMKDLMNGAVVYNDGLLYCYSDKTGIVSIVKPTENKFEIKGTVKVEIGAEQHWAHPVICNGILYVRHGNALLAYDVKK